MFLLSWFHGQAWRRLKHKKPIQLKIYKKIYCLTYSVEFKKYFEN